MTDNWHKARRYIFKVGQRVRPSQEGKDANLFQRKHHDQTGVVTKVDEHNSPTVLWAGRKTTSGYAPYFIEPDRRRKSARQSAEAKS